tara:strand:+ start:1936 stop:2193 length:258 start_codon:yes stop_codon:yes gene_type:complete
MQVSFRVDYTEDDCDRIHVVYFDDDLKGAQSKARSLSRRANIGTAYVIRSERDASDAPFEDTGHYVYISGRLHYTDGRLTFEGAA